MKKNHGGSKLQRGNATIEYALCAVMFGAVVYASLGTVGNESSSQLVGTQSRLTVAAGLAAPSSPPSNFDR